MKRVVLYPALILVAVVAIVWVIYLTRPKADSVPVELVVPAVRVQVVETQPYEFLVDAQGTVVPRREGDLRPQVSGEVMWVSPALVPGGFFEAGEALLRLDPVDYEADLEMARAARARSQSEARRSNKELERQRRLADRSVASQARIDDAENAARVSEAMLREANSRLGRAERDLARTELNAPYAGRVRSEHVDPGQFVTRGEVLADIYAVDYAEVRLPIPDRELGFIDLSLGYRERSEGEEASTELSAAVRGIPGWVAPLVRLRAEFAGEEHEWWGELVRTEGEIDQKTRMVTVVARIEDPYGRSDDRSRQPLAVGLFVEAMIEGTEIQEAIVLPRSALQQGERVFLIDDQDRVRFQPIDIMRAEREKIIVRGGLRPGDRVSVTPMPWAVEGMRVVALEESPLVAEGGS